ncbi:MAG: VOC family protein [Catenulispora sp.]|nr:VOC family protein [Catenulispora sp.]
MSGEVVHFEVPAEDITRARAFYGEAFGWKFDEYPQMNYTLVTTTPSGDKGPLEPGAINGGMLSREGPFAGPLITIRVDSIDSALETIGRLGGSTVEGRQAVGEMGFSAYFRDTEGNLVGLWENA